MPMAAIAGATMGTGIVFAVLAFFLGFLALPGGPRWASGAAAVSLILAVVLIIAAIWLNVFGI